ncbi:hypothetical protein J4221_07070 [Candidatus Pacearchaeota archaeon]|nr:hypothetical protein [Candidatus Pacearchaeota archaeon]
MKKILKILIAVLILIFLIVSSFSIYALTISSVKINDSDISPGDIIEIDIDLKNTLEDVEDVTISLELKDLPFAPHESSSDYAISEIKEDKIKNARFTLIVLNNAEPDVYKIPIKISYKGEESNETKTKNSIISLKVNVIPVVEITKEESLLLKGQKNEMSLRVINKGLSDVTFLEVEVLDSSYYQLLSPQKLYIGDLESDDFDSFDFNIFINNNVPDKINLLVKINYKDSFNNEYSENADVPVNVYDKNKAIELGLLKKSNTGIIIGIIITIILVVVLYRTWRKSQKIKHKHA